MAYPPHGVGRVSKREKRVILGVEEDVVVVELGNDLSVTLPISRAEEQLRPPATEADLKKVQKALREPSVVSDEIWSKRVQQAQEKLRSGDPLELAEIVRDGVRREQGKTTNGTPTKLSDERAGPPPEGARAPHRRDQRDPRGSTRPKPTPGSTTSSQPRRRSSDLAARRRRAPLRPAATRRVDATRRRHRHPAGCELLGVSSQTSDAADVGLLIGQDERDADAVRAPRPVRPTRWT